MATTTAPPPSPAIDHLELRRFLKGLRLQLWWREALAVVAACAIAGAILGATAVLWPGISVAAVYGTSVAAWLTLAAAAIGVLLAIARRPSLVRAARVADRQLRTESRLATAAEVLDGRLSGTLAADQLADTWRIAHAMRTWDAYPQGWRRVQIASAAGLISLVFIGLAAFGVLAPLAPSGDSSVDQSSLAAADTSQTDSAADAAAAQAIADQAASPAGAQSMDELQTQAA